jgi:hypothetical protein
LADTSLAATVPGNAMTLETELVAGPTLMSDPQIGFALQINTNDGTEGSADTEIYCQIPLHQAQEFAEGILGLIYDAETTRVQLLTQALEFKSAQLSCVKGSIGAIQITKIADSDRGTATGFGFFNLDYLDDQPEQNVMHSVQNIECYVPFAQEEQYEWLRTLVGGNHQFTSTIKVMLEGFSLEEVTAQFEESLRNRVS